MIGSSAAVADGAGDNEDVTERVRSVYREWKTQHIDDQLDDIFRFAHGGGTAVIVEPGTPMVWTIDPSEPSCPDCEDNSLAGAVAAGEPYPTGPLVGAGAPRLPLPDRAGIASSLGARCGAPIELPRSRPWSRITGRAVLIAVGLMFFASSCSVGRSPASTSTPSGTTRSDAATCSGARSGPRSRCS